MPVMVSRRILRLIMLDSIMGRKKEYPYCLAVPLRRTVLPARPLPPEDFPPVWARDLGVPDGLPLELPGHEGRGPPRAAIVGGIE